MTRMRAGYLGSLVVEQLLRCAPSVAKIMCLVRPKGKQSGQDRVSALLNKPLFAHLDKAGDIGTQDRQPAASLQFD